MRIALIRIAASFVFAALIVKADAFAQFTKLNVGYVGVTSDNAAAFTRAIPAFTRRMGWTCS